GTDWLRKAKAIINYQECKLTLKDDKGTVEIPCKNTSTMTLDSDDDGSSESEGEYEESGEDTDMEEDDDRTNFVGLSYELPQQETSTTCRITPEGIHVDLEYTTWETYDYLTYRFDEV